MFLALALDEFFLNGVPIDPLRFRCDIEAVVDSERNVRRR
jgi:hypothetical protein